MRGSRMYSFMVPGSGLPPEPFLNPSWPLTAARRRGCNRRVSWPPSLGLGRSAPYPVQCGLEARQRDAAPWGMGAATVGWCGTAASSL
jgi:hypothetical protein